MRTLAALAAVGAAGLAAAPAAHASFACVLSNKVLTISVGAGQGTGTPVIAKDPASTAILVDRAPCGGATVANTDSIVVSPTAPGGAVSPTIDLSGGALAPGATAEGDGQSEIEVTVNGGTGTSDGVAVDLTAGADNILLGADAAGTQMGVDTNVAAEGAGAKDADIVLNGVEITTAEGLAGADTIDARGGGGLFAQPMPRRVTMFGAAGSDRLFGGNGGDQIVPDTSGATGAAADFVDGGGAADTVNYAPVPNPLTLDLALAAPQPVGAGTDTIVNVENVLGGNTADRITGTDGSNSLQGLAGDDVLTGRTGDDVLIGSDGLDTASYENGSTGGVAVSLAAAGPQATGGAGTDSLLTMENLAGSPFDDRLTGDGSDNRLRGLGGGDLLFGGFGADEVDGGAGDDTLDGGPGPDRFIGGDGVDTADYSFAPTPLGNGIVVDIGDGLANDGTPAGDAPGDDVGADIERVIGTSLADDITGDASAEELVGTDGPDRLEGGGGPDRLLGGPGDDLILARDSAADAAIACGPGQDRVVGDPEDVVSADCEVVDRGNVNVGAPPAQPQPDPPKTGEGAGPGGGDNGATPPQVAIVTRRASPDRAGRVKVRVRCVYRAKRCRGSLTLTAARTTRVRLPAARRGGKARTVTIRRGARLGRVTLGQIPWGTSRPVTVRLSAAARSAIARLGRTGLAVNARLIATDAAAGAQAAPAKATRRLAVAAAPVRRLPRR